MTSLSNRGAEQLIDVTDKAIESTADEITQLVSRLGRPEG